MKVRATLIELWKKVTPFRTLDKIYWNGENNYYSEEIELAIGNSPTGSRAKELFTKYIFGKGIVDDLDETFNNGVLLSEVAKNVTDDVVVQNGSFIHTTYKVEINGEDVVFLPEQPKSLDYHKCRVSKDDDDENKGMIVYKVFNKLDSSLTRQEKNSEKKYYPFNPDNNVVRTQIEHDAKLANYSGDDWAGKIKHYRGQVMYLNLTPKFRYAVSKFDSVYNDLDTQYRLSVYSNTMTRGGFLGKTAILTQGLDEPASEQIKEDVATWLGSEGSSGVYHLDVEQIESLDNVLKVIQVPSQFDHKQFESITKELRLNILGAANNLPEELVYSTSGMFDGGEKYRELKLFYWEQCEWERQKIEEAFAKLGHRFQFMPIEDIASTTETTIN